MSQRKAIRLLKREDKARQYRAVALKGGGKREVSRRDRQMFGAALNAMTHVTVVQPDGTEVQVPL